MATTFLTLQEKMAFDAAEAKRLRQHCRWGLNMSDDELQQELNEWERVRKAWYEMGAPLVAADLLRSALVLPLQDDDDDPDPPTIVEAL